MNKRIKLAVATAAIIGGTVITTGLVSADDSSDSNGIFGNLAQRISERFDLDQNEVESFFAEMHQERHQEREDRFEARLDELVSTGEITEEQKQAILNKHEEFQAQHQEMREALKDLTPVERRETMETHHEEMKAWAEENGIDLEVVLGSMGRFNGMKRGMGKNL